MYFKIINILVYHKKKKSRHMISRDTRSFINSVLQLLIKKQHGTVYVTTKQIRNCAFHSYSYKANLISVNKYLIVLILIC